MNFPIVYVPSSVGVVDREEYRTPARIGSLISGGRAHEVLRNLLLDLQEKGRLPEVSAVLGIQVLLATHSKEIIHYVDPDELLLVDRSQAELAGLGPG